jgi:hypothetical protein
VENGEITQPSLFNSQLMFKSQVNRSNGPQFSNTSQSGHKVGQNGLNSLNDQNSEYRLKTPERGHFMSESTNSNVN